MGVCGVSKNVACTNCLTLFEKLDGFQYRGRFGWSTKQRPFQLTLGWTCVLSINIFNTEVIELTLQYDQSVSSIVVKYPSLIRLTQVIQFFACIACVRSASGH